MAMENVITIVLDKNKERYLRSKDVTLVKYSLID